MYNLYATVSNLILLPKRSGLKLSQILFSYYHKNTAILARMNNMAFLCLKLSLTEGLIKVIARQ